MVGWKGI